MTTSNARPLSSPDLAAIQNFLAEFALSWHEGRLAEVVRTLPPPGHPARLPALIGLVQIDLQRQWQRGRQARVEAYLHFYPELGTRDTASPELVRAEFEARQQAGASADWDDFGRRFPRQVEALRQGTQATHPIPTGSPPAAQSLRPTLPDEATLADVPAPRSGPRSATRSATLPAQFGRYRILKVLGRGGMGAVYLAHDDQLDRQVALKTPDLGEEERPEIVERFYREARAAASFQHSSLCPVYDVGCHEGVYYLTMAYIEGRPLAEHSHGRALPPAKAAAIVARVALAMQEAHSRGVVHRDLKPANIMINERGLPVVVDFGLAQRGDPQTQRLTQSGALLGTPSYMAPEQFSGDPWAVGPASDQYSLGVVLYELLTGRVPFEGPPTAVLAQILTAAPVPPSHHQPTLDRGLEAVCLKALAKQPADRYRSMADFARALTAFLKGSRATEPVSAPPAPTPPPTQPLPPPVSRPGGWRRPAVWWSVAGVALTIGLAVGAFLLLRDPPAPLSTSSARSHYEEGLQRAGKGEHDRAVTAFTEALKLDSDLVEAYCARAEANFHLSEYTKVVDDCDEVIVRRKPSKALLARAYCYRGGAYNRIGDFDKAIADCNEALLRDGQMALAYAIRGDIYGNMADLTKAIEDCTKAIELDPNLALAYAHRSDAHGDAGDLDAAIADAEKALKLNPKLGLAHAYLGAHYGRKGDYLKALAAFDQAIRFAPNEAEIYNSRAVVYSSKAQLNKDYHEHALADCNQAIQLAPRFAECYANRANVYLDKKDLDRAMKDVEEAIRLHPKGAPAYSVKAAIYLSRNDPNQALVACDTAIGHNPRYLAAFLLRGTAYVQLNNLKEALRSLDEAVRLYPKLANPYHERGNIHIRAGNDDQAIADLEKAASLAPKNTFIYTSLAVAHNYKRDYARALQAADQAIKLDDQNASAHYERGMIHSAKRKWEEAVGDFTRAIDRKYSPQGAAYHERGHARASLNQHALAEADFRKAIELYPATSRADKSNSYSYLGLVLNRQRLSDKAITACTESIQLNDKNAEAYFQRGFAHNELRQWAEAVADFTRAIERKHWDRATCHYNRAWAYEGQMRYKQAEEDYARAVELSPREDSAKSNCYSALARMHNFQKAYAQAIPPCDRALEINSKNAEAYFQRGRARGELKESAGAIADFTRVIKLNTTNLLMAHFNRGFIYQSDGRFQLALTDYTRAIELTTQDDLVRAICYERRAEVHQQLGNIDSSRADQDRAAAIRKALNAK